MYRAGMEAKITRQRKRYKYKNFQHQDNCAQLMESNDFVVSILKNFSGHDSLRMLKLTTKGIV